MNTFIHIHIHIYMNTYIHIYTYIYIYSHIYMYIYIHLSLSLAFSLSGRELFVHTFVGFSSHQPLLFHNLSDVAAAAAMGQGLLESER